MQSPPDTFPVLLAKICLRINGFRSTWPGQIIEIFATQVKFFEPFGYCTLTNCTFTFCTTNVFSWFCGIMSQFELVKCKILNLIMLQVHLRIFLKSYTKWNYACVSTPATTILLVTASTYHCLNCFGHVIYALQTSIYNQNIEKLLTHSSIFKECTYVWTVTYCIYQYIRCITYKVIWTIETLFKFSNTHDLPFQTLADSPLNIIPAHKMISNISIIFSFSRMYWKIWYSYFCLENFNAENFDKK